MCIVIWKKRDSSLYYRVVKKSYRFSYPIGYFNQYGHEVVFVIDNVYTSRDDYSFKQKFKHQMIQCLKKL